MVLNDMLSNYYSFRNKSFYFDISQIHLWALICCDNSIFNIFKFTWIFFVKQWEHLVFSPPRKYYYWLFLPSMLFLIFISHVVPYQVNVHIIYLKISQFHEIFSVQSTDIFLASPGYCASEYTPTRRHLWRDCRDF